MLQGVVILFLIYCWGCTPSTAAPSTGKGLSPQQQITNEVEQLDQLRKESVANQRKAQIEKVVQTPHQMKVNDEGSLPPAARGSIFRHREEIKKNLNWETPMIPEDHYAKFAGVQYSPADLADYILRTGDEEGVALAVEELVREGMMGRTDAINYLQDVKEALIYLRDQYIQEQSLTEMKKLVRPPIPIPGKNRQRMGKQRYLNQPMDNQKRLSVQKPSAEANPSSAPEQPSSKSPATTGKPTPAPSAKRSDGQRDKAIAMLEKLKTSNMLFDEYILEQVIYHLARDMFSQSVTRGDQSAEDTLTRLITYLEAEVENRRITPEMKERILEVISTALVDSLHEYPVNTDVNKRERKLDPSIGSKALQDPASKPSQNAADHQNEVAGKSSASHVPSAASVHKETV